jgi:hypothetical protein
MDDVSAEENATFDFIGDASFRAALRSDYRELLNCMDTAAWKAVHVLAGSVVEAILADYLVGVDYQKKTGKDPLKIELGPIISACKDEKIITERTADLSSVIRSYRNLIHPGRVIRLREKVDKKSATIAKALVDIVADEVATAKEASYGFTAEQIANKIEKDASAVSVLSHFLKETNDRERERLVMEVLPGRYRRESGDAIWVSENLDDYKQCYRVTLETLTPESKSNVAKRFVKILKEETGIYIVEYENAFFKASDLTFLAPNDAALAKAHILSRLETSPSEEMLEVAEGLGGFLTLGEINRVVGVYAKTISHGESETAKRRARDLLSMLYYESENDAIKERMVKRVDVWIDFWETKQMAEAMAILKTIKSEWEVEVPF